MIIMSVDLGKARTGIAVCDIGESFAFPKGVITEYNTEKLIDKSLKEKGLARSEVFLMTLDQNGNEEIVKKEKRT